MMTCSNRNSLLIQDGANIHIDPGPGALGSMRALSLDPARTDAILVSHCHPDHYVDAEVLLEGLAMGGFKRKGFLVGSQTVLEGHENLGPCISKYHQSLPARVMIVRKGDRFAVGNLNIGVTPTVHNDPLGVGFRLETSGGLVSYVSDTEIHEEVLEAHRGARLLILNLTRPLGSKVPRHLATEEAAEMVKEIKPEVAVLTHFGMKMVHDGVTSQSRFIEEYSGVRTIAAEDHMKLGIGRSIRISSRGIKRNEKI